MAYITQKHGVFPADYGEKEKKEVMRKNWTGEKLDHPVSAVKIRKIREDALKK